MDIDLEPLERARGVVRITVRDTAGEPVDSYLLRLFPSGGKGNQLSAFCGNLDGKLDATVPAGEYKLALSPRGGARLQEVGSVQVTPGGVVDLGTVLVEAPRTIRGTLKPLRGDAGGTHIGEIVARASQPSRNIWVGPFGEWAIEDIAAGRYSLEPGERSGIDFDPVPVSVPTAAGEIVRLIGRPCWRGKLRVRIAATARGAWLLQYTNCRGSMEQKMLDAGAAANGVLVFEDLHIGPGNSHVDIGPADGPLRRFDITAKGHDPIRLEFQ